MHSTQKPGSGVSSSTSQSAREVYNIQHIYLRIGDQLDEILNGIELVQLDPSACLSPDMTARLAMVTGFQYAEAISDQIAHEATLKRMDWKYALHLPIQHPGVAPDALCAFRQGLLGHSTGLQEFTQLLEHLRSAGLFGKHTKNAFDPLEILFTVCKIDRIYRLNQAMKSSLSLLVGIAPDWLRTHAQSHWYERYQAGRNGISLAADPVELVKEAYILGADIHWLIQKIQESGVVSLANQPEILYLYHVWEEQFICTGEDIRWRLPGCANCTSNYRLFGHG